MALHWSDNVHTTAFTPRDYQVELLAAAVEKNIIICLGHNSSKEFIALKLIQELAYQIRSSVPRKVSLYLTNGTPGESAYNLIYHLTDLKVHNANLEDDRPDWEKIFHANQVIIISPKRCLEALEVFRLDSVNMIIVEDCHKEGEPGVIRHIFENHYRKCAQKPKVMGLAGPLHSAGCLPGKLRPELEVLERCLDSSAETASDIVTVLRYCTKPSEFIVQCSPLANDAFVRFLEELVSTRKAFISDHRYDPSEIYSDEFLEELQAIPDPKKEPIEFLDNYLQILHEMGPWCADRAALHLLAQIEKQKVKTPYERHFLLLCLVSTTFVEIRAFCDHTFQRITNDVERVAKYSSPKILRLLEILKLFKPEANKNQDTAYADVSPKCDEVVENVNELQVANSNENVDHITSDKVNNHVVPPSKRLEKTSSLADEESCEKKPKENTAKVGETNSIKYGVNSKRPKRKYPPGNRNKANHAANDPDALCGIVFCNDKNTAKILFNLLYEVSRHDPDLSFLKVQYTVDRVADPLREAKEAEIEHRKQEEVLKRFRMHECNLLIGTSVLEEGIDLPKCNLVVRWDSPATYRSYVQCKGRARASLAFHMILVGSDSNVKTSEKECLCDDSHLYLCSTTNNNSASKSEKIHSAIEEDEQIRCEVIPSNETEMLHNEVYEERLCSMKNSTEKIVESLAQYIEIEKMLLRKCANVEPPEAEQQEAEKFSESIEPYRPLVGSANGAFVTLASAISLINRYCAKLPSDTFTKLTPIWRCAQTTRNDVILYQYTLRLPINSRLKRDILGIPMPTKVIARRVAALIACRELHRCNELDDALQPIGKEAFKASEPDWENFELEKLDEQIVNENLEPRPGTTKRRQYYYKRIASEFSDCRPVAGASTYLYNIKMTLECPIPEEQNTRGRKIYPPEDAVQGFGIMTLKKIPKVSAFPIFTRSGEVKVSLELSKENVILNDEEIQKINHFLNFTFTNVLRLQKYLMLFDAEANENCFFIVPTRNSERGIQVDWNFLNAIYNNSEKLPKPIAEDARKAHAFDPNKFKDAVVMPWYRNQDQPQYFYVAEICYHLSPESSFPGENYSTFKEYYFRKYGITIQNSKQPLLDVDHTSARLNFLTPRYVNRKGVALPTSSEETKKAKRENLEQKQILVPELCTIHPFPASLWRAAVCLPCILYRINALLLADEIRKQVSYDIGLGKIKIYDDDFEWPILDFGWSLSEVLKKSRESTVVDVSDNNVPIYIEKVKERQQDENDVSEKNDTNTDEKVDKISEDEETSKKTANDLLEEAEEKLKNEHFIEIGTWSNDMADHILDGDIEASDDEWGLLPPNVNLCSRNNTKIRYGSPTSWDVGPMSNNHHPINGYYSDSDGSFQSDDDYDIASIGSSDDHDGPIRIEFKANNVAEAIETEEEILKREKQLAIIQDSNANEKYYQIMKNIETGFDCFLCGENNYDILQDYEYFEREFLDSIEHLKKEILISGMLVPYKQPLALPKQETKTVEPYASDFTTLCKLVPYKSADELRHFYALKGVHMEDNCNFKITLDDLVEISTENRSEKYIVNGTGDIFDNFSDSWTLTRINEQKMVLIDYNEKHFVMNGFEHASKVEPLSEKTHLETSFSFDYQPDLAGHPGPSPSIILQALTMSNANDGINLERLETIGDSFLKYAITTYLYCTYEDVHEGKLSHLRSKQVSNLNLYRLGRRKVLGECMIATKFEPHDNWLPPCYYVPKELEKALIDAKIPACHWNLADLPNIKDLKSEEICELVKRKAEALGLTESDPKDATEAAKRDGVEGADDYPCFIPYNLVTQHSIPDKSVADCVEALIGAYLIECGPRGALLFMAWLGIRVLPMSKMQNKSSASIIPGSTRPDDNNQVIVYGEWAPPKSPLLVFSPNAYDSLDILLDGYSEFEKAIEYNFKDRAYLLQAMTHASYSPNRLSDCYQRLEFLGDAVLDYLITRHLYEDPRQHSPGALTDLRSALVNNTIFASLAVRHGFHKYFRHLSPGLNEVIDRFVRIQHENGHSISEEYYLLSEEECDDAEDVEVPKALGDVFESVAGAIFLDSNMSLDTVWKVYSNMMRPEIEQFSNSVPKSPIRELLELEPETAKFGKPEKLADGRRVRVTVEVFGKGTYRGIGRNYRIAKCTAAKCALRQLKKQGLLSKKH